MTPDLCLLYDQITEIKGTVSLKFLLRYFSIILLHFYFFLISFILPNKRCPYKTAPIAHKIKVFQGNQAIQIGISRFYYQLTFWFIQFILMKSHEQAQRTYSNPCNSSSAKFQYSFGRQTRFKQTNQKRLFGDKFYELPSQISKRGGVIARAPRDCQKQSREAGPSPGSYNPQAKTSEPHIGFAAGRDKCTVASVFYNTTITYPGPGKYDPRATGQKKAYLMSGKAKTSYETDGPGPSKYNFESTLLDRHKILSKMKKSPCARIYLPSQKNSRVNYTEMSDSKETLVYLNQSMTQAYISNKGKKGMGKSGRAAIIGQEQRFRPQSAKSLAPTPGPGSYGSFSDFIEQAKK